MLQSIPVNEEKIVAFKAIGKLNDDDLKTFTNLLEGLIEERGPLSLLIELENFHGWEPKAAWNDFMFLTRHENDFKRIAIIGEKRWEQWMTRLGQAFVSTETRYFKRDELLVAWDWLREETEPSEKEQVGLKPYDHILVATDFSPHAELAALRAKELAHLYQSQLTILHAVENYIFYGDIYDPTGPVQQIETDRMVFKAAEKKMQKLAQTLDYPTLQTEVMWGAPKQAILSYSAAQQVDLIVTGSHGRSGVSRLLGSTTNGILHGAHCDVMAVRIE